MHFLWTDSPQIQQLAGFEGIFIWIWFIARNGQYGRNNRFFHKSEFPLWIHWLCGIFNPYAILYKRFVIIQIMTIIAMISIFVFFLISVTARDFFILGGLLTIVFYAATFIINPPRR